MTHTHTHTPTHTHTHTHTHTSMVNKHLCGTFSIIIVQENGDNIETMYIEKKVTQ